MSHILWDDILLLGFSRCNELYKVYLNYKVRSHWQFDLALLQFLTELKRSVSDSHICCPIQIAMKVGLLNIKAPEKT